jgi:hypothetical protein
MHENFSLAGRWEETFPWCALITLFQETTTIQDLPGLPAGVKFDPTDQELLEHLEGKARPESRKLHPLVDEFIPTIEGQNGICYTHPERLPGTHVANRRCRSRHQLTFYCVTV